MHVLVSSLHTVTGVQILTSWTVQNTNNSSTSQLQHLHKLVSMTLCRGEGMDPANSVHFSAKHGDYIMKC